MEKFKFKNESYSQWYEGYKITLEFRNDRYIVSIGQFSIDKTVSFKKFEVKRVDFNSQKFEIQIISTIERNEVTSSDWARIILLDQGVDYSLVNQLYDNDLNNYNCNHYGDKSPKCDWKQKKLVWNIEQCFENQSTEIVGRNTAIPIIALTVAYVIIGASGGQVPDMPSFDSDDVFIGKHFDECSKYNRIYQDHLFFENQ
ncbi:hypothetical protein KJ966_01610 [bacterium]|nr:hypothetical protein [bacterium]